MITIEFINITLSFVYLINQKAGKSAGKLCLDEAVVRKTHSFLDFISNGTQLNCSIAIDFTGMLCCFENPLRRNSFTTTDNISSQVPTERQIPHHRCITWDRLPLCTSMPCNLLYPSSKITTVTNNFLFSDLAPKFLLMEIYRTNFSSTCLRVRFVIEWKVMMQFLVLSLGVE